jgi:hypothetical protein
VPVRGLVGHRGGTVRTELHDGLVADGDAAAALRAIGQLRDRQLVPPPEQRGSAAVAQRQRVAEQLAPD